MTFIVNQDMKNFIENNPSLVNKKDTSYPGVYLLKYKNRVFYDNLWDDYLEECRGTLIDDNYNIISRPFTKIYNYEIESRSPILAPSTHVTAFRKVNGFMVAVTWYNDEILVSTTGSTDSAYVKMALELIDVKKYLAVCKNWKGYTFMFECVHPNDPHIIPEEVGMYLLGYRQNYWNSNIVYNTDELELLSEQFGCFGVEHYNIKITSLQKLVKNVKHEGFVFYTATGISAKIKSPYYLIKKFVARNPNTTKLLDGNIKEKVDEEYYKLVDNIQENIVYFTSLTEQERLQFVRDFLDT
jgi:RNA ligase